MKRFLEIVIGIAIIAAICLGLNYFKSNQVLNEQPEIIRPVRIFELTSLNESFTRNYFGTVQGSKRADLSFRVSGTLNKIYVEKGASVKRGALLATLDPRDFNTRLSQAKSALSQAQAQHKNAQADFKRYENLYKQKVVPRATYDTYKTQLDVAASAVETAQAQLKSTQDALKDTELRAPFAGVIADRKVENFQDITAKQTIFSLQDISSLEIVFNIPDNDILKAPLPKIKSISELLKDSKNLFTLNAKFEAIPDTVFPLDLKEVAAQANTATNTYPVTAVMKSQQGSRILPGMAVTVEVDFSSGEKNLNAQEDNKYLVPVTAVMNENNNNYVWRYENNSAHKIQINTSSINNNGLIEISNFNPDDKNILNNGDLIITAGVYFLHEGQHVRPAED